VKQRVFLRNTELEVGAEDFGNKIVTVMTLHDVTK